MAKRRQKKVKPSTVANRDRRVAKEARKQEGARTFRDLHNGRNRNQHKRFMKRHAA